MRLVCVLFTFENNMGPTDGPTDLRTDLRTDGRTDGHKLLQRCDGASKNSKKLQIKEVFFRAQNADGPIMICAPSIVMSSNTLLSLLVSFTRGGRLKKHHFS